MFRWYLAGPRRLIVRPRPIGHHQRHCLEFSIETPDGNINDKQFAKGQRNLLVVHPRLRLSIFPQFNRTPIERAFIGEEVIRIPLNPATGGPAGPACAAFNQNGRLLKRWPEPRYTRISAALFLNEYEEGGEVKPRALMIHNPNAESPLPREIWREIPEFFLQGDRWRWSDDETAAA
jgi:hypothetical protein